MPVSIARQAPRHRLTSRSNRPPGGEARRACHASAHDGDGNPESFNLAGTGIHDHAVVHSEQGSALLGADQFRDDDRTQAENWRRDRECQGHAKDRQNGSAADRQQHRQDAGGENTEGGDAPAREPAGNTPRFDKL